MEKLRGILFHGHHKSCTVLCIIMLCIFGEKYEIQKYKAGLEIIVNPKTKLVYAHWIDSKLLRYDSFLNALYVNAPYQRCTWSIKLDWRIVCKE